MTKHGIRAPRKPRGEPAHITIANQEKQIKFLMDRCAVLEKLKSEAERNLQFQTSDIARRDSEMKELKAALENVGSQLQYCNGYIARVKECDQKGAGNAMDA